MNVKTRNFASLRLWANKNYRRLGWTKWNPTRTKFLGVGFRSYTWNHRRQRRM